MSSAVPFQNPTAAATDYQALRFFLQQRLLRIQTATLVQIQAVNGGGVGAVGTVDVLPLVNQVDGAGNTVPHVTLYSRPYCRLMGGANAVILDPAVGDIGLMVFGSRDLSSVIASGKGSPPSSARTFDYADGLYVFGCLNGDPEQFIQFGSSGITVTTPNQFIVNAAGGINLNGAQISESGEITDAAGIVVGTHKHSGVTTGTSETGGPVT